MRHEEYHVTVDADPIDWHRTCRRLGIKPLYIELTGGHKVKHDLHIMCAFDPTNGCDPGGLVRMIGEYAPILRIKHEVSEVVATELPCYWEVHVKIDGPYQPDLFPGFAVSRDLYRRNRWYVTRRCGVPFNFDLVGDIVRERLHLSGVGSVKGLEYEACLQDTNRDLDKGWA